MSRRAFSHLKWLMLSVAGAAGVMVWALPGLRGALPGMGATAGEAEVVASIEPVKSDQPASRVVSKVARTRVEIVPRNVTLRLTGSLCADEHSDVACNTAGIVAQVYVDRGSIVKKGDVLVKLDPIDAQNALNEALAAVQELLIRLGLDNPAKPATVQDLLDSQGPRARFNVNDLPEVKSAKLAMDLESANYKRAIELYDKKVIPTEQFEKNRTDYLSAVERHQLAVRQGKQLFQNCVLAQARGATLLKALQDCTIVAPFDGLVADRWVSPGERMVALFPGAGRAVTLLRIDPLRLSLTVSQQHVSKIRPGAPVQFETDAFPGRQFRGTVRYIAPAVANDSRSLVVEAMVPNPEHLLHPGMFANADLELAETHNDVFIPRTAVRTVGEVAAVFVVRDGAARQQIIALGEPSGELIQVTSGLRPGDVIVTEPDKVHDGDRVAS